MVWGVFLIAFGLVFAWQPLVIARFTGFFRFVPYPAPPSQRQMLYFRTAGLVLASAGIVLLLVA